jgi:hypothetical protein
MSAESRALEAAAEALSEWRKSAPTEELLGKASDGNAARVAVSAHLDALLADLPEEAVEAAEERFSARLPGHVEYVHIDSRRTIAAEALTAALRLLRDNLEKP